MDVIVTSPWIPAEWIKAHGHQPRGIWFSPGLSAPRLGLGAGACPFAQHVLGFAEAYHEAAFIFTTHCDQLRRAYDACSRQQCHPRSRLEGGAGRGGDSLSPQFLPQSTGDKLSPPRSLEVAKDDPACQRLFLFNLPATWQTSAARKMLGAELKRLGDFLVGLGGHAPTAPQLAEQVELYSSARRALAQAGRWCHSSTYAQALAQFHWEGTVNLPKSPAEPEKEPRAIRLALIGGPFGTSDWPLLNQIESMGGRVVLNATEAGERSLVLAPEEDIKPPHVGSCNSRAGSDCGEAQNGLIEELAERVLARCVDVFQRPNTRLYAWLEQRLAERKVQGLLLWHYVGCDLWRAEAESLREAFKLPLLLLEADESGCLSQRNLGRVQAFLEALG